MVRLVTNVEITYLGHSSFRIKTKQASIVTDPFDPSAVGLKFPKVEADIVTVSHEHADHNFREGVSARFITPGAGEYEVAGVSILGIPTFHDNQKGAQRGGNTVFVLGADNLRICHLGDLGHRLDEAGLTKLGNIDVLFVPVGGVYTIDFGEAVEIVNQIEPYIVVPMHYKVEGISDTFSELSTVEGFLKQIGKEVRREQTLVVSQKDLRDEELVVVVLERRS